MKSNNSSSNIMNIIKHAAIKQAVQKTVRGHNRHGPKRGGGYFKNSKISVHEMIKKFFGTT